ncbi:superinfection exclusion B family protein [Halalkalibacter akibai]|uniref:Putative phage membrane protein n=1 Tax=Halalkalibacter akibai (strain ATCC 43226 / DSM 21942 / CIP 109018 / JCM 9157 / 1139) TaxID=1236973 RepID=W4QMQ7_HALA3|nr:superinfection exclusion B family protein [Halalkalibacter akibai]GAE33192.1 putative phage membrane protein [Halalkalibacter akibai JCM 9157]
MKIDFNIKEILTLPTTIMAALSLASGILLFSPTALIVRMYMLGFREKYGFIIGIVFIVSMSILIVNLLYKTFTSISNAKSKKNFYATAEIRLQKLNDYQKAIIYALYQQNNRTLPLPLHDGAVLELEQNMMVGKATSQYFVSDLNNASFPYLLQPWVVDEINNKTNLLSDFRRAFELQYDEDFNKEKVGVDYL